MTKLIVRGRDGRVKKRRVRNDYPDHRYVVYLSPIGRTKPGVYCSKVTVDGKIAFVHPDEGRLQADIIPAMNVFQTKEKANAFFTGDGALRWVVWKEHGEAPQIFQARVKSYVTKRHGRHETHINVISRVDGKPVESRWDMVEYKTEREAYRHFASDLKVEMKRADEKVQEGHARKSALLEIAKKIKAFGIKRGYKKGRR